MPYSISSAHKAIFTPRNGLVATPERKDRYPLLALKNSAAALSPHTLFFCSMLKPA